MHYSLAVISKTEDDVHTLLERFSDDKVVPEYRLGRVCDKEIKDFVEYYSEGRLFDEFTKEEICELYKTKGDDWNRSSWRVNKEGEFCEFSTGNPDVRYDWYEIGGRFCGLIPLKDGKEGEYGSYIHGEVDEKKGFADIASLDDVDFSDRIESDEYKNACKIYIANEKSEEDLTEEDKNVLKDYCFNKGFLERRYKTKERYALLNSKFKTYSILLPDYSWYDFEEEDYDLYFKTIEPYIGYGYMITMIDYHI